jgi:hypothetical protein
MHRNRTWTLDPPEWRTQRNRLLPIEGGDGSTLNLDFTKGMLDSRIVFSRASSATFVDSEGYVVNAGENTFPNSAFNDANSPPQGWLAFGLSATATITIPSTNIEARKISTTSVSEQPFMYLAPPVNQGLVYTASVEILEVTDPTAQSMQYAQCITAPFGSSTTYYMNGINKGTGLGVITETGILSLVYTAGSTSQIRIGFANTPKTNCSITFKAPQHQQGTVINRSTFYRRTFAEGAYYAPRFDFSPITIGQPKGLLIEAAIKNHLTYSNNFANSPWTAGTGAGNDVVLTTANTSETLSPSGLNNAAKITKPVPPSGNGYGFIRQTSINIGPPSGPRTISIWVKQPTSNAARYFGLRATGDGFAPALSSTHATFDLQTGTVVLNAGTALYTNVSIVPYRNGWYRISATTPSMTGEVPAGLIVASYSIVRPEDGEENNSQSGAVYIWGPQLEIGTGASSYIPTGASTVTREKDVCYIPVSTIGFSTNGGTFITSFYRGENDMGLSSQAGSVFNTDYADTRWLSIGSGYKATTFGFGAWNGSINRTGVGIAGLNKAAGSYASWVTSTTAIFTANGATAVSGTISNLGTTPTNIMLGAASINSPYNGSGTRDYLNNSIASFQYFPRAFTAAQLETITDPAYVAPTFDVNFTTMSTNAELTAKGFIFNRLSPATFIGSTGYVDYADANMLISSSNLSGTAWTKNNLITPVAPSGIPAPNGSTTDITTVIPDTTNTQDHRIIQNATVAVSTPYNISFYVKPNGYNFFYLFDNAANSYSLTFNLNTNAVIGSSGISNLVIGTPDAAGWRKISFSFVQSSATTTNTFIFKVHPDSNFGSFAGNGTSGVLVWGFQLNPGTAASAYFPTTTAVYHAPRFDCSIIKSFTNLILQSNSFITGSTLIAPWAQKYGSDPVTLTANYTTAGVPVGFNGTATRFLSSVINSGITQPLSVPIVAGKIVHVSFFVKSNLANSQIVKFIWNNTGDYSLVACTTEWVRQTLPIATAITEVTLSGYLAALDISICGFQVEYETSPNPASSYIPTTTFPATVSTTAVNGLLMEGQATNQLFFSENITNGSWTVQAFPDSYPTVNITGAIAPNNTQTANLLTEGTGDWSRSIYQFRSGASGTQTYSVWVKAISGNTRFVRLVLSSGAGDFVYVTVNITTGAVTQAATARGTASAASAVVTPYPNSWYRIALTGTLNAGRTFIFIVPTDIANPDVNTGDYGRLAYVGTGAKFAVWGAQVETGSGATSYITTGASGVTRAADQCEMTSGVSSLYNAIAGTGTMLIDVSHSTLQNTNGGIELGAGTGNQTVSNRVSFRRDGTIIGNTGLDYALTGAGQRFKSVTAFAPSDLASSRNNGTPILSAANPALNGMNTIKFYIDAFNSGSLPVYGVVKQIQIWSTRLYNSTIQKLSAL